MSFTIWQVLLGFSCGIGIGWMLSHLKRWPS